ncbi:MAG: hypothetical protein WCF23_23020 [Candidatus Nitrosopolaris sp.]
MDIGSFQDRSQTRSPSPNGERVSCFLSSVHSLLYHPNGVFGDIGSIAHLINYETSLSPKFDIKLKGFCCYNMADYDRKQKQKLLDQQSKELKVTND